MATISYPKIRDTNIKLTTNASQHLNLADVGVKMLEYNPDCSKHWKGSFYYDIWEEAYKYFRPVVLRINKLYGKHPDRITFLKVVNTLVAGRISTAILNTINKEWDVFASYSLRGFFITFDMRIQGMIIHDIYNRYRYINFYDNRERLPFSMQIKEEILNFVNEATKQDAEMILKLLSGGTIMNSSVKDKNNESQVNKSKVNETQVNSGEIDSDNSEIKTMTRYFEKTPIDFVEHNSEMFMTKEACGRGLGYADPAKGIENLMSRYPDEFEGLTTTLKMRAVDGKMRDLIILSRDAVNLICFFSKQPRAKKMRKFFLEILREVQTKGFFSTDQHKQQNPTAPPPPTMDTFLEVERTLQYAQDLIQKEVETFRNRLSNLQDKASAIFKPLEDVTAEIPRFQTPKASNLHLPNNPTDKGDNIAMAIRTVKRNFRKQKGTQRYDDLITIAEAILTLNNEYRSNPVTAKVVGASKSYVVTMKRMLRLPDEVKQLIKDRKIDSFALVAELMKVEDREIQKITAQEIIEMPYEQALKIIKSQK